MTMLEIAARAIFESHNRTYSATAKCKWESDPDHWRRYAHAVIDALGVEALSAAAAELADEMDGLLPYLASHHHATDRLAGIVNRVRAALPPPPDDA